MEHRAQFRMRKDSLILSTIYDGDDIEFREDDGKYHSGYKFIKRLNDDSEYLFERSDGSRFKLMWWHVIRLYNDDKIRVSWGTDDPEPEGYEKPV